MKRAHVALLLMVAPVLFIVRAVVRYQEENAAMERVFGTEAERQAGFARTIASAHEAQEAGAVAGTS